MDNACDKAAELRECAALWEPGARLLGNVRADEIIGILDAYEQRIAELEEERDAAVEFAHSAEQAFCAANTELARVKAESLRVVPTDGDDATYALYFDDGAAYLRPLVALAFPIDPAGQPVRLERWEDEG